MTTATATAATADLPLCATLVLFLKLLYREASGFGRAVVGSGRGAREVRIPAGVDIAHLPGWLLDELQFVTPDTLNLTASTFGDDRAPLEMTAAFVTVAPIPTFGHTHRGMEWHIAPEAALAARARLNAFAQSPPVVIAGPWSLTAVWPLERPIRLDDVASKARAFEVQRRLWAALAVDEHATVTVTEQAKSRPGLVTGGVGPTDPLEARSETIARWSPLWPALPVPGTIDRSLAGPRPILFDSCADRRVTLDALEQALNDHTPAESGGQPRKAAR